MSKKEKFHVINVLDKTNSITKKIEYKNNQVMKQMNFFRGSQILVLPRAPDCLKTALENIDLENHIIKYHTGKQLLEKVPIVNILKSDFAGKN
jgi:hypothetical protein